MFSRRKLVGVAGLATVIAACSLTSLDDLEGDSSDAGSMDQCVDECVGPGGSGGSGASGGFPSGGSAGIIAVGGSGNADGGDATSPCSNADPQCQQCCVASTGDGAAEYLAAIEDCICSLTTVCQLDCATYCQSKQFDTTCTQCLGSQVVQQCLVDNCTSADCKAYTACAFQC